MKMKYLIYLTPLLTLFQYCKTDNDQKLAKSKDLTYSYLNYSIEIGSYVNLTESKVQYTKSLVDSIYSLNYIYQDSNSVDTITFVLKEDKNFEPLYLENGKINNKNILHYVNSVNFYVEKNNQAYKSYNVHKFAQRPDVADGCVTFFWTPELGIILERSATWNNFGKLKTNDNELNKEIDFLTELIYHNIRFYYGCDQEMELMHKGEAELIYKR